MKKILLIMTVLFMANLGCKKMDGGGGLCACSPVVVPEALLTIKSSNGVDLLNDKNTGAYTKDKIQLYTKTAEGVKSQVSVRVNQPFDYGNNKYEFYSLYIPYGVITTAADKAVFLKLGEKEYKLTLQPGPNSSAPILLIDGNAVTRDDKLAAYVNLFYLVQQ